MTGTVQRRLPLQVKQPTGNVPLVTVEKIRADLEVDVETVLGMVDEGELVAFDLSTKGTVCERRELRIYTGASPLADLDAVVAACVLTTPAELKSGTDFRLPVSRLELAWTSSHQQLYRLIRAGELPAVMVNGDWKVSRQGAAEFLKRRVQ